MVIEYGLQGLITCKFNGSSLSFFEQVFSEKFDKHKFLEQNFTFEINDNISENFIKNTVYAYTKNYYTLDKRGKTLINEIARYCDSNGTFPNEKDMSKKRGYIPRTQYYKYFKGTWREVYKYIEPVKEQKPDFLKCHTCSKELLFTNKNFSEHKYGKFGLKLTCRMCENKYVSRLNFKRKGINFREYEEIVPEQWWEYVQNGTIRYLPEYCLSAENTKRIIRYVLLEKLNLSRIEIMNINKPFLQKFNIYHLYQRYHTRLPFFNYVFPELEIKDYELERIPYNEELINVIITNWIEENNFTILNILNDDVDYRSNSRIYNMLMNTFISKYDMFIWYFTKNNIRHPFTNNKITVEDFNRRPPGYWNDECNRVKHVQNYCRENGIEKCLNDNGLLKNWIFDNFRSEILDNQIRSFSNSLYDTLIEAYPVIRSHKILFDWEWHQFNKSDKITLLRMMRELVEFRFKEYIKDPIADIPIYVNRPLIKCIFPKFDKHIDRKRFESYYQWCCESFPEYADYWKQEDFGLCVAFDGTRLHNLQEKMVYEFFKIETDLCIEAIGFQRSGKHIFVLPDEHEDNKYCADFYANKYTDNSKNIVQLKKPIYIEYYGWYTETNMSQIFKDYRNKTERKNEYFKNNFDIVFLDVYPCDIKNNFELLREKYNKLKVLCSIN